MGLRFLPFLHTSLPPDPRKADPADNSWIHFRQLRNKPALTSTNPPHVQIYDHNLSEHFTSVFPGRHITDVISSQDHINRPEKGHLGNLHNSSEELMIGSRKKGARRE